MVKDCRPVVFIGSSNKGLKIAEALQPHLFDVSEPLIWKYGAFPPGELTLETLERLAVTSDFAVLVATPDHLVERRGEPARVPTENILFELGLFMGTLGRQRTFIARNQEDTNPLPTNLLGITVCFFSDPTDRNFANALAPAAAQIKRQVDKLGFRTEHSGRLLEGQWKYHIKDARGGHQWGGKGNIRVDPRDPANVSMKGTRTWDIIGTAPRTPIACDWETTFLAFGTNEHGKLTLRFDHNIYLPLPIGAARGSCKLEVDEQFNRMEGYFYYHAPHQEFGHVVFSRAPPPARRSRAFRVADIEKLADELGVPQQTLLKVTKIASATLLRRRKSASGLLSPEERDRVYRVAAAYRSALQLFEGEAESARRWLNEPAKTLGGDSPLQHLDAEAGAAEVQDLIGRLEHGVYT